MPAAGRLRKGAGANGYIQRFIHFCNYALRGYNSCFNSKETQKISALALTK